jgi:AraC family transcriptional regulator, positive regulator of tynA and feaB
MKRIFSTDQIRPNERFDWWHESACRYLAASESVPDSPDDFSLHLDAAELGEVTLISIQTGSVTCTHAERHLEATADEVMLLRQTSGHMSLQHRDQSITLAAGQMALIDPQSVYTCRYGPASALLVVKYPRRCLSARMGSIRALAGRRFADAGISGLLSDFLGMLPRHELAGVAAVHASNQVLDLLAASLLEGEGGAAARVGTSRLILAHQLRTAVERSLADHTATAQTIARAVGISLRYANSILNEAFDTSLNRLLQARRLERCRHILANPLYEKLSISTIAYSWGFTDMTHFARRFRKAFGLLPSQYRKSRGV